MRLRGIFWIAARTMRRWREQWEEFEQFCRDEARWLNDYALYAVLRREIQDGRVDGVAGAAAPARTGRRWHEVDARTVASAGQEQVLQFAFARQWNALREAAARHGIRILGDVAIFVNMDSADVWVHPEIFELDEELRPIRVAGVPPDYFSATGQRWGNPLYRWDVLQERGFDWWIERMRRARRALRHCAAGPLPRVRGVLGDSGGGRDGGKRGVGEGAGAGAVSRAGSGRWGRCRWWPRTWG